MKYRKFRAPQSIATQFSGLTCGMPSRVCTRSCRACTELLDRRACTTSSGTRPSRSARSSLAENKGSCPDVISGPAEDTNSRTRLAHVSESAIRPRMASPRAKSSPLPRFIVFFTLAAWPGEVALPVFAFW